MACAAHEGSRGKFYNSLTSIGHEAFYRLPHDSSFVPAFYFESNFEAVIVRMGCWGMSWQKCIGTV